MNDSSPDKNHLLVTRTSDWPLEQLSTLEEAHQMMAVLMERNKTQAHLLVAWKRRLKEQNETLFRFHRDREEQMRMLTSQLLLLEANLRSKQQKIDLLLNQRDRIISQQQERIQWLERELTARLSSSLPLRIPIPTDPEPMAVPVAASSPQLLLTQDGSDSLEDSDSAVVMEDGPDLPTEPPKKTHDPRNHQVRVVRSISDVVEATRAGLHAVGPSSSASDSSDEASTSAIDRSRFDHRSTDRWPNSEPQTPEAMEPPPYAPPPPPPLRIPPIYARAVNNHRSVTRPRDIKCRKINKCLWKSTSMEADHSIQAGRL